MSFYQANSGIVYARKGQRLEFACFSESSQNIPKWATKSDTKFPSGVFQDQQGRLIFPANTECHSGIYTCQLSNQDGSVSKNVILVVDLSKHVDVDVQPKSAKVLRGGTAILFSNINGTQSKECEWTRMGAGLPYHHQTYGPFLILRNVQKSGEYYTSTVSNNDGIGQDSVQLHVDDYPSAKISPSNRIALRLLKSETKDVSCNGAGKPAPSVTWIKVGGSIDQSLVSGVSLKFRNPKQEMAGIYECHVSNAYGNVSARLQVDIAVTSILPGFDNSNPNNAAYGAFIGSALRPSDYHEINIKIKPTKVHDGLIIFQSNGFAENTPSTMHYISLGVKDRHITFYYSSGPQSSPAGISGKVVYPLIIQEGKWYHIVAKYERGWSSVVVNGGTPAFTFGSFLGKSTTIDLSSWIFLAGLSDLSLNPLFEVPYGFSGCISQLSFNNKQIDLSKPVESRQMDKCGAACEGDQVCRNGGTCQKFAQDESYFTCRCRDKYYGNYCEKMYSATTNPCSRSPCLNNGRCIANGKQHYCLCPMPYYGLSDCGEVKQLNANDIPYFQKYSYLLYSVNIINEYQQIQFEFNALNLEGALYWIGQKSEGKYLYIALIKSRLELRLHVNGRENYLISSQNIVTGKYYQVNVTRSYSSIKMFVDNFEAQLSKSSNLGPSRLKYLSDGWL
ncbi:uncharacterized protein TRIADDRAFT_57624 [Trichoplax adhaerens]|uniref:Uncharacterized protein n=1 Tax=Trichoplax adhaerens TaxID=10228 RepID=B3RZZ1_TRIAD|nr:hypothetical protein TRIADDRAFT_57624 [Trichoplax adhaerens]EDV24298.1 hypothetical protein TRIADDRAFT_57624 [Trichoplax adhaerens]|eukprot:XP_002113824.1 hypothetical protein TRIADDRAFT_57624 [Trichoplax adhaerens]